VKKQIPSISGRFFWEHGVPTYNATGLLHSFLNSFSVFA